jgi:branched-chain amino acid transport system ATP-binding protein
VTVLAPARRRWALDLGGAAVLPLAALFGLNLVDELDRIAFAALTPEIRDAFHLVDAQIVAIGSISSLLILVAALPMGVLGDRMSRVRLTSIAALVWGACAALTGLAWVVPLLVLARLGSGAARTSSEVVHPSLLADLYEPELHPKVFQVHRLASPLSAGAGLLVGVLGAALGWRTTFVLAAVPTFLLVGLMLRVDEPRRGASVGLDDDTADAMGFGEARRHLFGVRTLRRCWIGGFLLGAAFISNAQLLSLYFEHVHHYGPFGRGVVQFADGAGLVVGILLGARAAGRAAASARYERLTLVIAASFGVGAAALAGMAAVPWAGAGVVLVFVLGIGLGVYQPAYYPLVARIVDPRCRTQAYGWTLVCAGLGAVAAIPLTALGEHAGYRLAFALLAGLVALGALVIASSTREVAADVARISAPR